MYLGEFQLGDMLPVSMWCLSGDTPTNPDAIPNVTVWSTTAIVETVSIPIFDQNNITGFFRHLLNLDGKYSTGKHTVISRYTMSGVEKVEKSDFEIIAGGDASGAGIAMEYFRPGIPAYVLYQADTGVLLRKKNPSVSI